MKDKQHQHISSMFDEELNRLRTHVLQMGGLVETQLTAAVEAYASGDVSHVKHIVENDRKVNELEVTIDDECAHIIAMRQPTASDLRLVLGISRMMPDLERAGDEAKKIAKGVRRIYDNGHAPSQYAVGVRHLAAGAMLMVRQALDAFARLDGELARSVIRADDSVDVEFKSIMRQLITHMMEDPRTITVAIEILSIARGLERVGDHAKNIAEHVIFIVEGRDVRHNKEALK